ncbi:MAG: DMT family transporter [Bacteroidales bacterium]|nr:DMT family transporter [Bacteroidales bacterium]
MNKKILGTICSIGAAVCYGTNLLGALKLYAVGMNTGSVLLLRFGLAWCIIAIVMLVRKEKLKVTRSELRSLTGLGLLFVVSSLTLYLSFHFIEAGVASTILFVYPVMTAIIMRLFFHERQGWVTIISIVLSFIGVVLLYWNGSGQRLNTLGVVLVLLSALSYALYIIVMNRADLRMSSFKINFYVLIFCAVGNGIYLLGTRMIMGPDNGLTLPPDATAWFWAGWLAVVPAILALVMMVYAAKYIGSTPTAIMGALEPLTAVLLGILVFGEHFSANLAIGIVLILSAVILIALRPIIARHTIKK